GKGSQGPFLFMINSARQFLFVFLRTAIFGVFCSALSLFCVSGADAADYYWRVFLNGVQWGSGGSSPSAACEASGSPQPLHAVLQPNGSWKCNNAAGNGEWVVTRSGDSCPSGTEYDSTT